jgi:hypothetical protein
MLRTGTKALTPIVAVLAVTMLMGQGIDSGSPTMAPPADEASPAVDNTPPATHPDIPSATAPLPENKSVVVPVTKLPAAPAAKKEKTAKAGKTEVLPWANAPIVPAAPGAAPDPTNAVAAATAAQCAGLFEAPCRDVATCAWVGDIKHGDGTTFPAHCAGRGTAPPKKAASAKPKPKPKPEATAAAAPAPAATASAPIKVSPPASTDAPAPAGDGAVVVTMPTPQ